MGSLKPPKNLPLPQLSQMPNDPNVNPTIPTEGNGQDPVGRSLCPLAPLKLATWRVTTEPQFEKRGPVRLTQPCPRMK